jgi:hypothetical protein
VSGRSGNIRAFDITLAPVADLHNIPVAGRHNILEVVGHLPSLGCRVVADIRIVLVVHTAQLDPHRPRSGDTGQVGFEVAVRLDPSSRKDQRRSGLVEGR